jgi:3-phenylpropionate/trans-cinnamate dioxygenase ferredoxin reductase component
VTEAPIVIVGAGLAGLRAAQAIRTSGHDGEVVVIGAEPHLPYTRPPLSKGVLEGTDEPEATDLGGAALDVSWRLGTEVVTLLREARQLILGGGEQVPYRRLIVASGCRPRCWSGPGADLDGVLTLRTLDDSLALRERLVAGARIITIGAGFIGCEVAATARTLGRQVSMVDIAPHPLPALGPALGAWAAELHRRNGVGLHLGTGVASIEGAGHVEAVRLDDGTHLEADVVVVALGAVPNTDWLEGSGLAVGPGLRCDATLTSISDPDVLGAGDACTWPHPLTGGRPLRVEHWTNAVEQGRLAGSNVLRDPSRRNSHRSVPYVWSDQYGVRIQAAGLPADADRARTLEAAADGSRLVLACERGGRIRGAIAIAAPWRMVWYRKQIEQGAPIHDVAAAALADRGAVGPPREAVPA